MLKTIEAALAYIHSRPRLHRSEKLTIMTQALQLFDQPQKGYPTIHITGTNGKGTTSALISQLLSAHGLKVGLFISPFVDRFNERIQINQQPIADADLITLLNQTMSVLKEAKLELTEFELVTLLMFRYFSEKQIDVGVIEVGIGGAHDRTNVIDAEIGVITSIGMDHEQLIGPKLTDIAKEKAGIIKPGQTTFLGRLPQKTQAIINQRLADQEAQGFWLGQDIKSEHLRFVQQFAQFDWTWQSQSLKQLQLPALADWQVANASLALGAAACFLQNHNQQLSVPLVKRVVRRFQMIGRLEIITHEPLLILDGAHNVPAMTGLITMIKRAFNDRDVYLIIGMMADKDIRQVEQLLQKTSWHVYWTTVTHNQRAATQSQLKKQIGHEFRYFPQWQTALQVALQESGGDGLYLFAGSFYLISDVRHFLLDR